MYVRINVWCVRTYVRKHKYVFMHACNLYTPCLYSLFISLFLVQYVCISDVNIHEDARLQNPKP